MLPLPIPLPLILAWKAVHGFWSGLPGPIKAALLIALAGFVGMLYGEHKADARCQARIDASIQAAKDRDSEIAAAQAAKAATQRAEAVARSAADKEEMKGYVEDLAKQTVAGCTIGADADRNNLGLDVLDDAVQPTRPKPARRRQRHPDTRPVPQGTGK